MTPYDELRLNIFKCKNCGIRANGQSIPSFGRPYMAIAEAPGYEEVNHMPLIGPAGQKLWKIMGEFRYVRDQFALCNTVQCRPVINKRNGKPTLEQMISCSVFVNKMLEIVNPKKIIIFGGYARKMYFDGRDNDMIKDNGKVEYFGNIPMVLSIHPANMIYRGEQGVDLIRHAIKTFKGL